MIHHNRKAIEVIFILGGHAVKDSGGWRSTRFNEGDQHGNLGDYLRPIAVVLLVQRYPQAKIVILGSRKRGHWPGTNSVIEKELLSLGVPPKNILKWQNSSNTFNQLLNCQRFLRKTKSVSSGTAIVSNRYHLPRVKAMVKFLPSLRYLNYRKMAGQLNFFSAENVLIKKNPQEWKKLTEENYRTAAFQERMKLERRGTKQIKKGIYKLNS